MKYKEKEALWLAEKLKLLYEKHKEKKFTETFRKTRGTVDPDIDLGF